MYTVRFSRAFEAWHDGLRDNIALDLIASRIDRLAFGVLGDAKSVGAGVLEARIHYGPGYRLYFAIEGQELILLLAGGTKDSQKRDIERAIQLKNSGEAFP
jgi:putative addiction module killer protein